MQKLESSRLRTSLQYQATTWSIQPKKKLNKNIIFSEDHVESKCGLKNAPLGASIYLQKSAEWFRASKRGIVDMHIEVQAPRMVYYFPQIF